MPYEKVGKNEPVCIADEVPFEIPESWEWVRVKSCTELYNGKAFKPSDWTEQGLPIVRIQNLNNVCAPFNYYDKFVDEDVHLYGGELLFAWSGTPGTSFGAHIWQNKEAVLNQHIFKLIFDENSLYKPFYMYALNERVGSLIKAAHGSAGLQHVTRKVFESTLIPLPPFAEQKRIVTKLNTLMPIIQQYSETYSCIEELNNYFPDRIKKSILQEAVQGKLVPQDPSNEPASVLLERIRAEKERLIQEGKIKRDKHESVIYRRDNSHYEKRGSEEVCIDEEIPFEVPSSWALIRLNDIGIYKKGPFGSSLTKSMFVPKGADTIKVYEQKNAIQKDHTLGTYYITRQYYESKMKNFTVEPGDILVSCAGTIGETYVLPEQIEIGIINQALMRMTIYAPIDLNYFLLYFDYVLKQTAKESSKGSAIKNIPPFEIFKKLILPLPPLEEQKCIVAKVRELENLCNLLCS